VCSSDLPISGRFSPDQAAAYAALLRLQKRLIAAVRPGVRWPELSDLMFRGVFRILQKLGVLPRALGYDRKLAVLFLPHDLSHHIGANVHDHCEWIVEESKIKDTIERVETLAPGHVISIEPGIYFHLQRLTELDREKPPYDQVNIERAVELAREVGGIRIEDDVAVTEDGVEVLSAGCPKEIAEIEALLASAQ
jgi:Xaa-Pro aminopeptidase